MGEESPKSEPGKDSISSKIWSDTDWDGLKLGRYQLAKLLNEDDTGRTFLAHDLILKRDVALKTLHADVKDPDKAAQLKIFLREAQATARLEHPNVLGVYDVVHHEDVVGVAMERAPDLTLQDLINKKEKLPFHEICRIMAEACDGLGCAHENGMIHRDIKPGNLALTAERQCKVQNFGAAHVEDFEGSTENDEIKGTPYFMSPEVIKGKKPLPESDIYAMGISMWWLITGRPPFIAKTRKELYLMHLNQPVPDISQLRPDIPPHLRGLIDRCLAKDPAGRYRSCSEFADALRAIGKSLADYEGSSLAQMSAAVGTTIALKPADTSISRPVGRKTSISRPLGGKTSISRPAQRKSMPTKDQRKKKMLLIGGGAGLLLLILSIILIIAISGGDDNKKKVVDTTGDEPVIEKPDDTSARTTRTALRTTTTKGKKPGQFLDIDDNAFFVSKTPTGGLTSADTRGMMAIRVNNKVRRFEIQSHARQDVNPTMRILDSGTSLHLKGNAWKVLPLDYVVKPDTILEFDLEAVGTGEIIGIGLCETNADSKIARFFVLGGCQDPPINQNGDFWNYKAGSGEKHYVIPVGKYYTGQMHFLHLEADDDVNSKNSKSPGNSADAIFSNIQVYEGKKPFRKLGKVLLASSESTPQNWRYTTDKPSDGWNNLGFDDANWDVGQGMFGTAHTPGVKVGTVWNTKDLYIRRVFIFDEIPESFALKLFHDDGVWVFINGKQVFQSGKYTAAHTEFPVNMKGSEVFRKGRNVIAVHCHQNSGGQGVDVGLLRK